MILQIDADSDTDRNAARNDIAALVCQWGHELSEHSMARDGRDVDHPTRAIDPVSLTALIVSLPAAALAVFDLTDRIRNRRRAQELIEHARRLADGEVTVFMMTQDTPVAINALEPDQLLELLTRQDPTTDSEIVDDCGPRT